LRVLKLIDWDFLKEENTRIQGGTKGYAAPEVCEFHSDGIN
jgi:hypothetical protein